MAPATMRLCIWLALSLTLFIASLPGLAAADEPAEHNRLTAEELAEGWLLLFDGHTDYGWKAASQADWNVADGVISVASGEPGLLCTTTPFADYVLKVDFRAAAGTNSGVFLRTVPKPIDPAVDCYELNIADPAISPFPTGSCVKRQRAEGDHDITHWRTFEVTANGGEFTVALDGQTVLTYSDPNPIPSGLIGLQLNAGAVEFRNIKLKPLNLQSIFNGRDLTGWTAFPDRQSVYSVTPEGWLNVKNGPGSLMSEGQYGDFVLQLEVFSNGQHLNSGIFFRSIPGEFTQGYECQIQNGYQDGDRSKPLDCGTGGFYRRQNARQVLSDDFTWFPLSLIATGDHMAAWVNGIQVSDWTDERPADPNPRKGLRREPGVLSIQGHDPTTDLSFRNLRIVELPAR
jgi:hypothetical protein